MRNKNIEDGKKPKLIEDLGMRKFTETSKEYRFGKFECQYCGKDFECRISSVNNGETRSCGCIRGKSIMTHGLKKHQGYRVHNDMMRRCYNEKSTGYKDYGGRGITVCEEWKDIVGFIPWFESNYIEGYTLDRINNYEGYNPDNCRFVDATTQAINRRIFKSNTSGFVGIAPSGKKWGARIRIFKKDIRVGSFKTKEEAVQARDQYIIENKLPNKLSTDYKKETK